MAHMSRALLWALLVITPLCAQMIVQPAGKSVPQAKTREELDAFGMVMESGSPQAILTAANRFRGLFPKSEFYEYACVAQMQAAMDLSDTSLAEESASVVLRLNPNDPEALLTLAEVSLAGLATGTGVDAADAQRASEFARAALDRLRSLSLPPLGDRHTWLRTKRSMLARGHLALAQVSMRRKQWEAAEHELHAAIDLVPSSKAYLCLSEVYTQTNSEDKAAAAAKEAQMLASAVLADKPGKEIQVLQGRESSQ